ncbi:hypothetical protein MVAC_08539 [Mycolicibacterium vaccae ATCC 25954]|uniref:Uncharacterized protein n=1 Tax=Mycolicibacterium vaccae ATCC 25954 TaxID=1194972 RepID=K0V7D8_MYCVA|nr:hypothetical protein MVAC_08539 [Mycolicibacterium vaccae ATCC 25954]
MWEVDAVERWPRRGSLAADSADRVSLHNKINRVMTAPSDGVHRAASRDLQLPDVGLPEPG